MDPHELILRIDHWAWCGYNRAACSLTSAHSRARRAGSNRRRAYRIDHWAACCPRWARGILYRAAGLRRRAICYRWRTLCLHRRAPCWPCWTFSADWRALGLARWALGGQAVAVAGHQVSLDGHDVTFAGHCVAMAGQKVHMVGQDVQLCGQMVTGVLLPPLPSTATADVAQIRLTASRIQCVRLPFLGFMVQSSLKYTTSLSVALCLPTQQTATKYLRLRSAQGPSVLLPKVNILRCLQRGSSLHHPLLS